MRNLLVSGGAGFIGSNFIRYVLSRDEDLCVVNLDALTYAGSRQNLQGLPAPDRHRFVKGDICDAPLVRRLLREQEIDTIVHFAAETHVDRSIQGPEPFIRSNVVGTFTLLEAARDVWLAGDGPDRSAVRFHHISTDEVYGELQAGDPACTEETPYAPSSPYAASKASSDHLVRAYGHTYGLPFTITNCTNNYGPYQHPEKFIPLMITRALGGQPLPVYGDGQQIRDWLYVEDHCRAIYRVLRRGRTGETYHVAGGTQPTNLEVVQRLCRILDEVRPRGEQGPYGALITFVEDRPGHDRRYALDTAKITGELGWRPEVSLQEGLERTVAWMLDHGEWLQAVTGSSDFQDWHAGQYPGPEREGE